MRDCSIPARRSRPSAAPMRPPWPNRAWPSIRCSAPPTRASRSQPQPPPRWPSTRPQRPVRLQSQGSQGPRRRRLHRRRPARRARADRGRRHHRGHRHPRVDRNHPIRRRASPAGVLLALDRQERGAVSALSAVQEVGHNSAFRSLRSSRLADLMRHMRAQGRTAEVSGMQSISGPLRFHRLKTTPWKTDAPRLKMAPASGGAWS
jgi:hypothetical protein